MKIGLEQGMGGFITGRRAVGLALALAGLVGIGAGAYTGRTMYLVFGMGAWWLLVFGGVLALLQRASMLMQMVAAARADLGALAAWQTSHPDELWRQLTRIGRDQRRAISQAQDETLRLRKETKRALAEIERAVQTIADEQAGSASVQSLHHLSVVSALVDSADTCRKSIGDLEVRISSLDAQVNDRLAAFEGRLEAQSAQVLEEYAQETRRGLAEHSTMSLRVYRDISAELDRWKERHEALRESLATYADGISGLSRTAAELKSTVEGSAGQLGGFAKALDATGGHLESLRATYEEDKRHLKALSRDEKQLRSISRRGLQWLKYETVREVEAVLQLRQLLSVDAPTPLLGGWAMDPESVLALVQLLTERRPGLVVELGSGASTVWIAMALRQIGSGKVVSYDHLPEYAAITRKALEHAGLQQWAEVREAPLTDTRIGDETFSWYGLDAGATQAQIDVLLVDGPPGSTGPLARYPAVPRLVRSLREHALVIVDDAARHDEEEMVERWIREFPALKRSAGLGPRTIVLQVDPVDGPGGADAP